MKFKIEKGIGLKPPFASGTISRAMYEALNKMKINESFVIKNSYYVTFHFIKGIEEFNKRLFVSRTEDNKTKRIYRLK